MKEWTAGEKTVGEPDISVWRIAVLLSLIFLLI